MKKNKSMKLIFIKTDHLFDYAQHWQLCNRSYLDVNQESFFYIEFILSSVEVVDRRQLEKNKQALYNIKSYNRKHKGKPPKILDY